MLGTLARPGALLELHTRQLDFEHSLIHLNPDWREQTKKYRPTVKMPVFLRDTFQPLPEGNVVTGTEHPFRSVKKAFRATRARAGLEATVTPYSFRHTLTRWLRSRSVPAWEVAAQLGHRAPGASTTEIYAPFDPMYLTQAVRAIDEYFGTLRDNCVTLQNLEEWFDKVTY